MATQVRDKQGNFLVAFRWAGKQFTRSLKTRDAKIATAGVAKVEETLMRLARGYLEMPPGADPGVFIVSSGKMTTKPVVEAAEAAPAPTTLGQLFDIYERDLTPGSKEANSLATEQIHRRHLTGFFGTDRAVSSIDLDHVQKYVNSRSKAGWVRATISKELATLRMLFNWASRRGHMIPMTWQVKELTFPKTPPASSFQTWKQIEAKIAKGGLSPDEKDLLWESLFLDAQQILACLAWVRDHAGHSFIHPMFAFAAYTGARRGEILRSQRDDFDFTAKTVSIRQKKSDRSRTYTTRLVPLHSDLNTVMTAWFQKAPASPWTICTSDGSPIGERMATKYFRGAVKGSKWDVLHGFHVFRHSIASIMACKGKDQREIDGILGHSTDEMVRRYRHLFPERQEAAFNALFDQ